MGLALSLMWRVFVGRGPKGLLILAFVVILGVAQSLTHESPHPSKVKSIEKYWAETGLKPEDLEELVQDYSCSSSLRYFLACVNATSAILYRQDLGLFRSGDQLVVKDLETNQELTERQLLEPWRRLFLAAPETVKKLNFETVIRTALLQAKADRELVIATGLNGFLSVFRDPHTYIMPLNYFYQVVSKSSPKTKSLGVVISRTAQNYFIRKIYPKSPAEDVGLKKGDYLISINGKNVTELTYIHVNELIRKNEDMVKLKVLREGKTLEFYLARREVEIPSVSYEVMRQKRPVGVLSINKFSKDTCDLTEKALHSLLAENIDGLILDLRDNSGGQIEEASCIAGLFLGPHKKLFDLQFFDTNREREEIFSQKEMVYGAAMAILVNRGSASASELLAGALRDHGRALLVGERTFGKGSFQEGEVWNQNSKIALFSSRGFYLLPSGFSPQMYGLKPDVEVHFVKDTQPRESEQYINALYPPSGPHIALKKMVSAGPCIRQAAVETDDKQLLKAEQVLFCSEPLAGVSHDNDESF
jgi:carboxyl-terminal processing protease